MVSIGGTNIKEDILRLKSGVSPVHIVVGTPKRIKDLAYQRVLNLERCGILVLDEADKLLGDDFYGEIKSIISYLPKKRQIMLFSATFPLDVKKFKDEYLNKPVMLNLMDE